MAGATATVKGGLFETAGITTLTQIDGTGYGRKLVAQLLGKKSLQALRATMRALDGAAAGGAISKNNARIQDSQELGGVRTIENEVLINRVSAASDITDINGSMLQLTTNTTFGANPIANLDGNPLGTR